jgi:hopanoid biosynthesis associated RND transporter like protein HpnN
VAVAAAVATAALGAYFVGNLRISTDTTDMISPKLPFRQTSKALSNAFPQYSNNVLIVVEGATPDLADDAARALAERLRERPRLFGPVFHASGDPFFRRNGLLFLDVDDLLDLSERLAEAQPFVGALWRDFSLRGLFEMLVLAADATLEEWEKGKEPPIEIGKALERIAEVAEAQAAGRFQHLSWQKLMQGEKADDDRGRRFILIQPALDFATLQPAGQAIGEVRALVREMGLDGGRGIRVRLTGSAAVAMEELASVKDNMEWAAAASLILVVGLLAVGLGSIRLVVPTLAALVAGLVATGAFAIAALGQLNLISIAFAVFSIGLGVDYGIHFALRYREGVDAGRDHAAALAAATAGVGGALTLCTATSMIGFFSFLPTDYVGLAELGLIGGVGMAIALFANLTVLPALLRLMPLRTRTAAPPSAPARRRQAWAVRHAGAVSWGALALGLAGAASVSQARFDFDPMNLRDRGTESVATLFDLMEDGRTSPYTITVLAESLPAATALAERLKGLPEVDATSTVADFVPEDQREKLDIIANMALFLVPALEARGVRPPPTEAERREALERLRGALDRLAAAGADTTADAGRRLGRALARLSRGDAVGDRVLVELERRLISELPGRLAALREALEPQPIAVDGLPERLRLRYLAADGRARVEVYPKENVHDRAALRRFVEAVRTLAPDATGSPVVILESGNAVIAAFQIALAISASFVIALVAAIVRNLREVLLVLAPLALAALLTIAASVALRQPLNFANVIVLPLLFGLTVHFAIHLVLRDREERAGAGSGGRSAFETTTPRAVILSALTTIGSFGSISFSSHPGTASMGILLTVALALALLSTLVVLPALMARFPAASPDGAKP